MKKPKLPDGPYGFDHIPDKFDSSYDEMHLYCQNGEIRLASLNVRWSAPHMAEPLALGKAMAAIPALLAALESAYNRSLEWVQNMELIRGPHSPEVEPAYLEVCEIRDEYKAALEAAGYDFSDPDPEDAEGHAEKSGSLITLNT